MLIWGRIFSLVVTCVTMWKMACSPINQVRMRVLIVGSMILATFQYVGHIYMTKDWKIGSWYFHKVLSPNMGSTKWGLVCAFWTLWGFLLDYGFYKWLNANCIQRLDAVHSLIPKNATSLILRNRMRFQDWASLYIFDKVSANIDTTFIGLLRIPF